MGSSCLLTVRVAGNMRLPLPPARMIPLRAPLSNSGFPANHAGGYLRDHIGGHQSAALANLSHPDPVSPPGLVIQIPPHGPAQTQCESFSWAPAELSPDFSAVNRVASIMPGPVGHEADEPVVRTSGGVGRQLIKGRTQLSD